MTAQLQRRLGVLDAVTVGAGSMIGAGVFSAWGPATDAAGTGVLIGLVVAAAVAFCNATSSAQLAAVHPESGGTYVYARRQLGPSVGLPRRLGIRRRQDGVVRRHRAHRRRLPVARPRPARRRRRGRRRGDRQHRWADPHRPRHQVRCSPWRSSRSARSCIAGWSSPTTSLARITPLDTSPAGVLRAGGFLFFAFAGYARIATLGEEVRDPATTIPKAIPRALAGVLAIYAVVGVTLLAALPVDAIAASDAPLGLVVSTSRFDWLAPIVRVGAGIAALGVLLNLIPGVSRTVLAMARRRELPHWFATIDDRRSLPLRAEAAVTAVVIVLTATLDLRGAIGFSGVTILTYYAITNAACLTLPDDQRRWPPRSPSPDSPDASPSP